jgi:hypothetical protein
MEARSAIVRLGKAARRGKSWNEVTRGRETRSDWRPPSSRSENAALHSNHERGGETSHGCHIQWRSVFMRRIETLVRRLAARSTDWPEANQNLRIMPCYGLHSRHNSLPIPKKPAPRENLALAA